MWSNTQKLKPQMQKYNPALLLCSLGKGSGPFPWWSFSCQGTLVKPGGAVVSVGIVIIQILACLHISKHRMHFVMKKDNHGDHEGFSHRLLRSALSW